MSAASSLGASSPFSFAAAAAASFAWILALSSFALEAAAATVEARSAQPFSKSSWQRLRRYLRKSVPPEIGAPVLGSLTCSSVTSPRVSIILRHSRAYIDDQWASSVAFSKIRRMTCRRVRPSVSASDLLAHVRIWPEIESKFSIVSLLRRPLTFLST